MPIPTVRLLTAMLSLLSWGVLAEPADYRAESERFIVEMVKTHNFDQGALATLLGQAHYSQEIIDAINRPYEAKPWRDYRKLFLTPERIEGGVAFWRDNAETLRRAESRYGVKAEILVAIIGVETNYGSNVGRHRVLDALTTLGFTYPKRAAFFRSELEHFLLLTREEQIDPVTAVGSYAGALGKPQFISSSYRAYAVDFDEDGRRDLWGSNPDVIGSVANYFARHGWRTGEPVTFPAAFAGAPSADIQIASKQPLVPNLTLATLRQAGVRWPAAAHNPDTTASLILLDGDEDEYWVGLENFYVLTRYNHSNLYAMAVHQLSEEIRAGYDTGI